MAYNNRYDARTDKNQVAIVKAINSIPGCIVIDLSGVGSGCPDILIEQCRAGVYRFHLVEIKTKKGKLNKKQVDFHAKHHCHVIKTIDEIWSILEI